MAGPTYVVFDGDNDSHAYYLMKAWTKNNGMSFNFEDAHDLDSMTYRAQSEAYVKSKLRERMRKAERVVVLVGGNTKYLYKFVRWELELAIELGKPIIVVNLNNKRVMDEERCPPILKGVGAIHISYSAKVMEYAINNHNVSSRQGGTNNYYYYDQTYKSLGL